MTVLTRIGLVTASLSLVFLLVLAALSEVYLKPAGFQPFDVRWANYSSTEAKAYVAALAETGGDKTYVGLFHQLDSIFPILVAATLLIWMWQATKGVIWFLKCLFVLFPLFFLAADLMENARVARMLTDPSLVDERLVSDTMKLTRIKWFSLGFSGILILGSLAYHRLAYGRRAA